MVIAIIILVAVVMGIAVFAGIINGLNQGTTQTKNNNFSNHGHTDFIHPTKATVTTIPPNPCFFNIGSTVFHKSRECNGFSIINEWDAVTESEAIDRGMTPCPKCKETIVFVYSRGKVYHKTKFCSDSQSLPSQIPETQALSRGLHRCSKCWTKF